MLIRISLIIALIAGLAVAGLNFFQVKAKVDTLVQDRNTQKAGRIAAETDLAATRTELDKTTAKLKSTEETLATTTTERDEAVATAAKLTAKTAELTAALEKTTAERDAAQADLAAYTASGFTAEQLSGLAKQMKNLEETVDAVNEEKKILARALAKATNELARLLEKDWQGPALPAALKGTILVSDPKFNFVVLDVGEDQGVLEYGELLVSRDGKLVAKIRVREVQKDRAVANLVPGWVLGDVMEGDIVTPAHPAS